MLHSEFAQQHASFNFPEQIENLRFHVVTGVKINFGEQLHVTCFSESRMFFRENFFAHSGSAKRNLIIRAARVQVVAAESASRLESSSQMVSRALAPCSRTWFQLRMIGSAKSR